MNYKRETTAADKASFFFLFGTLLCSLCQLTVSARPGLPQNGEDFRGKLTKILEVESLTAKHDYDPQDQTHVVDDVETTSDSKYPPLLSLYYCQSQKSLSLQPLSFQKKYLQQLQLLLHQPSFMLIIL